MWVAAAQSAVLSVITGGGGFQNWTTHGALCCDTERRRRWVREYFDPTLALPFEVDDDVKYLEDARWICHKNHGQKAG